MRFRRVRGNIMGPSEAPVPREAHTGVVGLRWSHVFPWLFKTHFSRSVKCISLILLVLLRGSNWPKRDFSVIFMLSSIFPTPQCHALVCFATHSRGTVLHSFWVCTIWCLHCSVGWYMRVCWSQDGACDRAGQGALRPKEEETNALDDIKLWCAMSLLE